MMARTSGNGSIQKAGMLLAILLAALVMLFSAQPVRAAGMHESNGAQVLEAFDRQQVQRVNGSGLSEHKKHLIVFIIGVPLILLLFITGGLGIAMGVFGKQQLFLPHMILAGLTMTLAVVHVVVTLVWFFPF